MGLYYFLGIVTGFLFSLLAARFTIRLSVKQQRSAFAGLCADLIVAITDLVQKLDDTRSRIEIIEHEFLETIKMSLEVYSRNQEKLYLIGEESFRKDVRDYFTRVYWHLHQVKSNLSHYYDHRDLAEEELDEEMKLHHINSAKVSLDRAREACDRLKETNPTGKNLCDKLRSFSSYWL